MLEIKIIVNILFTYLVYLRREILYQYFLFAKFQNKTHTKCENSQFLGSGKYK